MLQLEKKGPREEHGASIGRRPSKRQQEKTPEGRIHTANNHDSGVATTSGDDVAEKTGNGERTGHAPEETSKFKENL